MVMPVMKQLGVHTTVCLAIGRQLLQEGECRVDQVDGLLSRSAHSARGRTNSIWRTRSFVCLAVPGQQTPPSTAERIDLSLNGFGKKKTTFPKDGNVDEGHEVIVSAFPALREGYEILRATEGRSRAPTWCRRHSRCKTIGKKRTKERGKQAWFVMVDFFRS